MRVEHLLIPVLSLAGGKWGHAFVIFLIEQIVLTLLRIILKCLFNSYKSVSIFLEIVLTSFLLIFARV